MVISLFGDIWRFQTILEDGLLTICVNEDGYEVIEESESTLPEIDELDAGNEGIDVEYIGTGRIPSYTG